jgi:hypothetical protein
MNAGTAVGGVGGVADRREVSIGTVGADVMDSPSLERHTARRTLVLERGIEALPRTLMRVNPRRTVVRSVDHYVVIRCFRSVPAAQLLNAEDFAIRQPRRWRDPAE